MKKYIFNNWQKILVGFVILLAVIIVGENAFAMAGIFPFIGEVKKDSDDPDDGKSKDNPSQKDNQDENIKALQRKITDKDKELKTALREIEDIKKKLDDGKDEQTKLLEKVLEENTKLTAQFEGLSRNKKIEALAEKYPDIATELIVDLDDDKIEAVVEKQRKIAKEQYGDSQFFEAPQYSNIDEIDAEIKQVQENSSLSGIEKAQRIMGLSRRKEEFFSS